VRPFRRLLQRANLAGWLFVVLLAVLAEAAVRGFELRDSVPAPSATVRALADGIVSGTLVGELGTTLEGYVQGLVLAIAGGVCLGVAIGSSRTLRAACFVVIEFLRPIPAVALIPLAIFVFGVGLPMRRLLVAYAAVWPILMSTLYGVRGTDRILRDVAATSGVTGARRLVRLTLPAALPSIAAGIRMAASLALLVVVTVEFVMGTEGIGGYMQRQQSAYRLPELYAAVVLIGLLGYAINVVLRAAEERALFWVGDQRMAGR
jgi:ABC-type nitrate/sulfonate/bicarbonate transport system permease component